MFSFFNSFAASTNFEKYRLQITGRNFDSPNEVTLRNMMRTFCSEDQETRAQIAYATIIKKLLNSDSRSSWIYILKNLIILDRVIEEGVFVQEISESSIDTIESFRESDYKYILFDTERMIKTFWRLMKQRTNVVKTGRHIFCYKRSQRQDYLASLSAHQTLNEIQSIQNFFALTFDLVDVLSGKKLAEERPNDAEKIRKAREQFTRSKLLEYIYLQVMHKFMLYYSCQLLCNNYFLQLLIRSKRDVSTDQIRRYRRHIIKFKLNADEYIMFIEKNKAIKGFEELNYKELNPFHKDEVLKIIDKLLVQQEKPDNNMISNIDHKYIGEDIMKVQKRPNDGNDTGVLVPRIKIKKENSNKGSSDSKDGKQGKQQSNPFMSWINAYSNQFPQKEIMTVDLITLLKKEQQSIEQPEQFLQDVMRENNMIFYDLRDTNVNVNYQLNVKTYQENINTFFFKNIYSTLASNWNAN